jgi:hypothetical protein
LALLLIALTWMLLAGIVVVLCRAARLGDASGESPGAGGEQFRAVPASPPGAAESRLRRPGRPIPCAENSPTDAFTKSLRRRAGLHRA